MHRYTTISGFFNTKRKPYELEVNMKLIPLGQAWKQEILCQPALLETAWAAEKISWYLGVQLPQGVGFRVETPKNV